MLEITLPVEDPKIKINGDVYALRQTEIDIVHDVNLFLDAMRKYDTSDNPSVGDEEIRADAIAAHELIDKFIGEGATYRISRGRPVRLTLLIKWLGIIAKRVAEAYAEASAANE